MAATLDRIRGCLLAGAIGDALGAPVEFMRREEIRQRYGQGGIRDLDTVYGVRGAITDDTQMTLFTAEGLIRARLRQAQGETTSVMAVVHGAYLRWLLTQGEKPALQVRRDGWLIHERRLWARRAPGNTCLAALAATRDLGEPAYNDSKGCGGVMRVAPSGLVAHDPASAFELGCEIARLTHGHVSGYLAGGAMAALIALLLAGAPPARALERTLELLAARQGHEEVSEALALARRTAGSGITPDADTVERLGGGWVAEEALAIAVYCALATNEAAPAIVLAANHSGDTDSTAAICGNLVGTMYGAGALPRRWLDTVELREVIDTIAFDLYRLRTGRDWDPLAEQDRYPAH